MVNAIFSVSRTFARGMTEFFALFINTRLEPGVNESIQEGIYRFREKAE
jgi:hypothetical protein